MKKIGLIGGITPEYTVLYYRVFNQLNAKNSVNLRKYHAFMYRCC
jgi:aspartate/glutamate racemase